jgi:hypothetical protein
MLKMEHNPNQTRWWESRAYEQVRGDIQVRLPDHLQKIGYAKQELARNAKKKKPNPACTRHNEWIIRGQLEKIQQRFARWQQRFSDNGYILLSPLSGFDTDMCVYDS